MARKRTSESAKAFHAEHDKCWMCTFLRRCPPLPQLHHIAGRGKRHDVRANYAALCHDHHGAIQSSTDAEVVCLALKQAYDYEHYDPALICDLRGWAPTHITHAEIDRCWRIMGMMREAAR